jgi:hypothetical protein
MSARATTLLLPKCVEGVFSEVAFSEVAFSGVAPSVASSGSLLFSLLRNGAGVYHLSSSAQLIEKRRG